MATRLGTLHEGHIIWNNLHGRRAVHEIVLTNPKVDLHMPICGVHQVLAHRGLILVDNVDVAQVFNPGEESEKNDARPQHMASITINPCQGPTVDVLDYGGRRQLQRKLHAQHKKSLGIQLSHSKWAR